MMAILFVNSGSRSCFRKELILSMGCLTSVISNRFCADSMAGPRASAGLALACKTA